LCLVSGVLANAGAGHEPIAQEKTVGNVNVLLVVTENEVDVFLRTSNCSVVSVLVGIVFDGHGVVSKAATTWPNPRGCPNGFPVKITFPNPKGYIVGEVRVEETIRATSQTIFLR
jgi:hypothetical protein